MSWRCEEIQDKRLSPASSREAYNLHLAALEWSLVEPIIINKPEDIKATNWRDTGLTPYTHQVKNLITFCRKLPVGLIADDVGLGKTISAGLIVSELMSRRKVSRVLIICPKVLTSQWVSELEEKFKLFGREFTGKDLKGAFQGKSPIVVTTYHSASNRLADLQDGMFDMVILDEAHKLRNLFGNQSSPAIATNIRKTLERRPFKYVLMLTATPIQNRVWDLYSLIDILKVAEGKANPLGNPAEFSQNYLEPGTGGRKLMPHMAQEFQNRVKDCISRNRRSDVLLHFPRRIIELFRVPLTVEEKKMIKVVADQIENLNPMLQTSIAQAMMSSPRALVTQVKNMSKSGTLMPYVVQEIEDLASRVKTPAKLGFLEDWIAKIIRDNPTTWRVVVFTVRLETQAMLHEVFKAKGYKVGLIKGGEHHANQRTIDGYRKNPPEINLIISSDAGSEGINLQAGNTLVNYDLPWNPMIVEQRIGRVQRLGSDFSNVSIGNLVGQGTVEERIVGRLTEKLQGVAQAIGDIEGILEAANIDEEEGSKSYESRIRELVVGSLRGVDVSQVQDQMLQNIEIARQIYEAEKRNIDVVLGNAGTDHASVKAMPRIETKPPQMPSKEFVLRAMKNNGYRLDQKSESMYEATKPGAPVEKISFSENELDQGNSAFGGQNIKQYIPGRPHFERLVQHWVDHNGHHVTDSSQQVGTLVTDMARSWVSAFPGIKLVDTEFRQGDDLFFGAYHIRVKASNGVDSYEKIISGRINQELEIPLSSNDTGFEVLDSATRLAELAPMFQRVAQAQTNSDNDIGRFCKFYQTRLEEGLQEAGSDRTNERKLKNDFEPKVHAEVVGLEGFKYQKGTVRIRVDVDSFQYLISIPAIPACRRWLEQPPVGECALTGLRVPQSFLESCVSTGMQALRHKMEKYGDDGFVIPSELVECEYSGARMLKTDAVEESPGVFVHKKYFVVCDHTQSSVRLDKATKTYNGKWCKSEIVIACPLSQRKCLPIDTVKCFPTGRLVCNLEALQSVKTNHWYAKDQLVRCDATGLYYPPPDIVVCNSTGNNIHYTEAALCHVLQKNVRRDLLEQSAISNVLYCKEFGTTTSDGRNILKSEAGFCSISNEILPLGDLTLCESTNETISKKHAGICKITGQTLTKTLLVECAATGDWIRKDLATILADGQSATPSECGLCSVDGKSYLLKDMDQCSLTNQLVSRQYLDQCFVTNTVCRKELLTKLHDGRTVLPRLANQCSITGKTHLNDDLVICASSNDLIAKDLAGICALSGKIFRNTLLVRCVSTGNLIRTDLATVLADGQSAIPSECGLCSVDGKSYLLRDMDQCSLTNQLVSRQYLDQCFVTNTVCRKELLTKLHDGRTVLPRLANKCSITGKTHLNDDLVICASSHDLIAKDLAGTCTLTGRNLRRSLLVECASTGALISKELARELAGGRFAIPSQSDQCSVDHKYYLLSEMGTCDLTGNLVMRGNLAKCSITGANVRRDKLASLPPSILSSQNDANQRFYCPDLTVKDHAGAIIPKKDSRKCAVSGMICHVSETTTCQHTGATIHESMSATCQVSGKLARKDILLKSAISGILMLPDFAVKMSNGGYGTSEETGTCLWTGQMVNRSRLKKCKLTGIPVCKELLNESQEIATLRDMLSGKNMGIAVDPGKLSRLKGNPQVSPWIKGKVTENPSPLENTYAIAALHTGLLGINVKVYVAVMRSDPDGEKLLGKFSTLERRGGLWWILDT